MLKTLVDHECTIIRQAERKCELENQYYDLDNRLDDQLQYSRRTSLPFHNVPCPDPRNVHKMNTDKIVLDICNNNLEVPITLNELGRTHPIGKVTGGKVQVIARFIIIVNDRPCIVQKADVVLVKITLTNPDTNLLRKMLLFYFSFFGFGFNFSYG